ncbi:BQ2448_5403 [Microbotryum intermedium]|uniref:histidine kinase n=1 Tax=Microbotryum intermedium TaxID=269621 RepID=A0A238F0V8_9BASI|nr:BQ2448_5403 [Microbotryum intermedium]
MPFQLSNSKLGKSEYPLPPPAVAFQPPSAKDGLKVRWSKIKRRVGNGSAPGDSLGDPTTENTSDNGSSYREGLSRRRDRRGSVDEDKDVEDQGVDVVVVEASGAPEDWRRAVPRSSGGGGPAASGTSPGGTHLKGDATAMQSEGSSIHHLTTNENAGIFTALWAFFRWRVWGIICRFFFPAYVDAKVEEGFQKEQWWSSKAVHIFGSCFLVFSWLLAIAILQRPWTLWNKISFYGLQPFFIVPLVPMAALDVPRRRPWLWQAAVFCALWIYAANNVIDMYTCGFYTTRTRCGNKDFLGTMYYPSCQIVIGLFALGQKRLYAFIGAISWVVIVGATLLPHRVTFIRNVVNLLLFQGFILYLHYVRELADRRMYTLRAELKIQYQGKARAQQNERKQMDARRRFSSYIFHEVRVPLNTASLVVQQWKALGLIDPNSEAAVEFQALDSSLTAMSQVLNDTLDFTRMERGGFTSVSRPFSLHDVMNSIFGPLKLDAHARGLAFETALDLRIDDVAKRAMYPEGTNIDPIAEGDGWMMGDEMRLRQVINNLASNACKFTPAGGTISIVTRLVFPDPECGSEDWRKHSTSTDMTAVDGDESKATTLSSNRLEQHNVATSPADPPQKRVLVARIEVRDTGVGIKTRAMAGDRSLFSAFVQTEIGRQQAGKGTGLGLSLVRQIVMLSGGRLGVKSKVGEGSTFWVEMPFGIGPQAREVDDGFHMVGMHLEKASSSPSPPSNSTHSSDLRFTSSLAYRPGEPGLGSIGEKDGIEMKRTSYTFSPPSTMTQPKTFIPLGRDSAENTPPATPLPPSITRLDNPQSLSITTSFAQEKLTSVSSALSPSDGAPHRPAGPNHLLSSASAPATMFSSGPPTPNVYASTSVSSSTVTRTSSPVATPGSTVMVGTGPSAAARKSTALEFADGALRVLVVDDDTLTRKLMSRMLERLGCLVSTAENGAIALDMLLGPEHRSTPESGTIGSSFSMSNMFSMLATPIEVNPPISSTTSLYDITFLDNQMPVTSGLQVVQKMRSLGRTDLIVGVTANALRTDQEEYLEQGASFVLTKPVLEADLRRFLMLADRRRAEARDSVAQLQRQSTSESRLKLPLP